jgi:hypothetical protein
MKISKVAVFAAAMAFCGAAYADKHGSTADKIKMLDSDGDGQVSAAEYTAKSGMTQADFDTIDANKDGFATTAEMDAHKAMKKDTQENSEKMDKPKPMSDGG